MEDFLPVGLDLQPAVVTEPQPPALLQPAVVTEPQPPALLEPAEGPELRRSGWTRRPPVRFNEEEI